jgi:diguanylate cyclase (GGDEF)-like protein
MNNLKEGVSLRKIHNWLIVIAVILSCFLIYSTYRLTSSFMYVKDAAEENIKLENAIHELMEASDYLTEMVQRFTVYGDSRFMNQYFMEVVASKRREKALSELKTDPDAAVAVERMQEAMNHSLKLMDREFYAMRLVIEAKKIKEYPVQLKSIKLSDEDAALSPEDKMHRATEMVLDEEYYEQKNNIRKEVQNSVKAVEQLTQQKESESLNSFETEMMLGRAGIVLNILAICFVVWLTSSLGINPIVQAVDQIKSDSPIQETGAEEFRYLARAYNNLYAVYKKSIERLNFKASHDELTGAYNRAGFDLLLTSIDLNSSYLIFFDVDNFKSINDTYGHDTGDKALQKLVQVLKSSFRSDDYVCRIGGDEFAVFMIHSGATQQKLIDIKMEQINRELADAEDGLPSFSVSAGIVHGSQAKDVETLIKKGDQALYVSKKRGKHTHTFYDN